MSSQLLATKNNPSLQIFNRAVAVSDTCSLELWEEQAQEHSPTCCLSLAISQPSRVW